MERNRYTYINPYCIIWIKYKFSSWRATFIRPFRLCRQSCC